MSKTRELYLYSDIGSAFGGVTSAEFIDELNGLGKVDEVNLRINSSGGDVFEGSAMANALHRHPAVITVDVDGLAASVASYVAMAASPGRLRMAESAFLMVHEPWAMKVGNAAELRKEADLLDKVNGQIASAYQKRSGKSAAVVGDWLAAETWFDAEQSKRHGLIDSVTASKTIAARINPEVCRNVPEQYELLQRKHAERLAALRTRLDRFDETCQ